MAMAARSEDTCTCSLSGLPSASCAAVFCTYSPLSTEAVVTELERRSLDDESSRLVNAFVLLRPVGRPHRDAWVTKTFKKVPNVGP